MSDPTVVLFSHPGAEHDRIRSGPIYPWHRKPKEHKRKYLRASVRLARAGPGGWRINPEPSTAAMWAEYEPPTLIHGFQGSPENRMPSAWHEFTRVGAVPGRAHGTDPWIFGESFRYGICKQDTLSDLQHLQGGDVLFFGSWMKCDEAGRPARSYNFFLDTVFVVEKGYANGIGVVPSNLLDRAFVRCAWERIGEVDRRTLYSGVTLGSRTTAKPFSWVPCLPARPGEDPPRFRRPMIGQFFLNKEYGHGQATVPLDVPPEEAWSRVTKHCLDLELGLAARVESPGLDPDAPAPPGAGSCREPHSQ
jgi:hypothetical protein